MKSSEAKESAMAGVARYVYELGVLKSIRRTGWWVAGVKDPETVAEHSFRTAVIGFVLATMEEADPFRTAALCLFHDAQESRIGDLHRITRRYVDAQRAEERAFGDQARQLPKKTASLLLSLAAESRTNETLEARLARDADMLECLIQAREYQAQGCASVRDWIENAYSSLQTSSARKLAERCMEMNPEEWWHGLKAAVKP